ncbi:MAG: hypothetical protein QXV17_03005 [Candidatus Micrarchaeaceae archaeon]
MKLQTQMNPGIVFRKIYTETVPEISFEVSTTGRYVARLLRDMGFIIIWVIQ